MIINTKNYADFVKLVKSMGDIDGIFYVMSGSFSPYTGFGIWAYTGDKQVAVQAILLAGTTPGAPDQPTVVSDFPSAVQLAAALVFSDQSAAP